MVIGVCSISFPKRDFLWGTGARIRPNRCFPSAWVLSHQGAGQKAYIDLHKVPSFYLVTVQTLGILGVALFG
jgi:hypothetical protein